METPLRRRYFAPSISAAKSPQKDFTRKKHYFMKNRMSKFFATRQSPFLSFEPTHRRIKVSLHQLINDLLANLQPHARNRNNVIHNGIPQDVIHNTIPQGLCFILEENTLASDIWNLLRNALRTRQNEPIHVLALIDDHHTTISVKNAAHQFAYSIPNSRLAR
jgi:hypothetical protein